MNRAQLIGKVDISSKNNPRLIDQTNREGLRDNPEKKALKTLLLHILIGELRDFLETVDKTKRKPVTFVELEGRVEAEEERLELAIRRLREIANKSGRIDIRPIERSLRESMKEIERTMRDAKELADQYDQDRSQVIHLAGLGMMVEHVAHELVRTTEHTLRTLIVLMSAEVEARGLQEQFRTESDLTRGLFEFVDKEEIFSSRQASGTAILTSRSYLSQATSSRSTSAARTRT